MKGFILYTDGSVNISTDIGFGAMLMIDADEKYTDDLRKLVKTKIFEQTSSTKLELQTLLWALNQIPDCAEKITVYTDSQNIIRLKVRRERMEKSNYYSKKGVRLKNWELYKDFFLVTDKLNCRFIKVKGHKKSIQKDETDRFFTLVDRASRKALREENNRNS